MKPEQKFCNDILHIMPGHVQRIEATGNGIPDLNVCCNGVEAWFELKIIETCHILLRKEQWAWMRRRVSEGGQCYILAKYFEEVVIFNIAETTVEPYGKSNKYVLPCSINVKSLQLSKLNEFLINFVFTRKNP